MGTLPRNLDLVSKAVRSHGNILNKKVTLTGVLLREITQTIGKRTTGDRMMVRGKSETVGMQWKGQIKQFCWRQTQPDNRGGPAWFGEKYGDCSELREE